jgi:DNA gyrase subunit A
MDPRVLPKPVAEPTPEPGLFGEGGETEAGPFLVAFTEKGSCLRLPLDGFMEPSNRNGRTFMRVQDRDTILGVEPAAGDENVCLASRDGYALIYPISQIPVMKGAAKGVIAMRLGAGDRILGFALSMAARQGLEVETSRGRRETIRTTKFDVSNRGNRGRLVIQRGTLTKVFVPPVEVRFNGNSA